MSSSDSAAAQQPTEVSEKARGKSVAQPETGDMSMDEEESSGEESGAEEVCPAQAKDLPMQSVNQYTGPGRCTDCYRGVVLFAD